MKPRLMLTIVALAIAPAAVSAHALDEYVQALKIGVTSHRLELQLALTPGINVASEVLRHVDVDGDEVISTEEAKAYGRHVIADLAATLDGTAITLLLHRVEVPTSGDLRAGSGVIRIEAVAADAARPGEHRFVLRNKHLPTMSVYLANALLPESRDVQIKRQSRDERQQTYLLDYEIGGDSSTPLAWMFVASIALLGLVGGRML